MSIQAINEARDLKLAFAQLAEIDDAIDRTAALTATIASDDTLSDLLAQTRNRHTSAMEQLTLNLVLKRVDPQQGRADILRHYHEHEQELRSILKRDN